MISSVRKFFQRKPLVVVIRLDGVIGAVSRFGSGGRRFQYSKIIRKGL